MKPKEDLPRTTPNLDLVLKAIAKKEEEKPGFFDSVATVSEGVERITSEKVSFSLLSIDGDISQKTEVFLAKGQKHSLKDFASSVGFHDLVLIHDVASGLINLEVREGDSYSLVLNLPNSFSLEPQKRGSGFLINNCFVDPGVQDVEFSQLKQRSGVSTNGKLGFHDRGRKYGSSQ